MRRAFTLIELLVVIAIIAILAAILFPVFAQAKLAAKKTTSMSNVKQVSLAGVLYLGDNDDVTTPILYYDPNNLSLPSTFGIYYWPILLLPYTKSEKVYLCPMDTADDPSIDDGQHGRFDPNNMFHDLIVGMSPSYGLNIKYLNQLITTSSSFYYTGVGTTVIQSPANTVAYAEATMKDLASVGNGGSTVTNPIGNAYVKPPSCWQTAPSNYSGIPPYAPTQGQLRGRFDKDKVLVGWLDGHVKYTAINQLKGDPSSQTTLDQPFGGGSLDRGPCFDEMGL